MRLCSQQLPGARGGRSFLQLSSTRRVVTKAQRAREAASRVLLRQGQKSGNKALVQLAAAARLDNFKAVTESIQPRLPTLKDND